jgi:hypothetical protein
MAGLLSFSGRVDAPGENFRGNALWQLGHIECPRLCPTSEEQRVSIQYDSARARFVVRWREDGKHRTRRFDDEADAVAFDAHVNPGGRSAQRSRASRASIDARVSKLEARRAATDRQDGVYPYATNDGVRWRFVFRQSDGSLSSRRDFTSRTAATAARRKVVESVDRRELTVCRETFASFWDRFAAERRPYMTTGSHRDLTTHGRKRQIPFFGAHPLAKIDEERVRDWLATMIELVEADELAPKTVNNARMWLSVALNEAVRRRLLPRNPCADIAVREGDGITGNWRERLRRRRFRRSSARAGDPRPGSLTADA